MKRVFTVLLCFLTAVGITAGRSVTTWAVEAGHFPSVATVSTDTTEDDTLRTALTIGSKQDPITDWNNLQNQVSAALASGFSDIAIYIKSMTIDTEFIIQKTDVSLTFMSADDQTAVLMLDKDVSKDINTNFIGAFWFRGGYSYEDGEFKVDGSKNISLNFDNVLIDGNGGGCAIYDEFGTLALKNAMIRNCAPNIYGAVVAYEGNLTMSGCVFTNNTGGAVMADRLIATNCFFSKNSYSIGGGAVVVGNAEVDTGGDTVLTNCTFTANHADGDGGAIKYIGNQYGNTLQISGCVFDGNTACDNGGAIFALGCDSLAVKLYISGTRFMNNTAGKDGGAIWIGTFSNEMFPPTTTADATGLTAAQDVVFSGNKAGQTVILRDGTQFTSPYDNNDVVFTPVSIELTNARKENPATGDTSDMDWVFVFAPVLACVAGLIFLRKLGTR